MAEPAYFGSAAGTDEQAKAAGMAKAAQTAAAMPKVNPATGELPDTFSGKFGFIEALANDSVYGDEIKKIKAALEAGNTALAETLYRKSKWAQLDTDAQDAYLLKLQNSKLYQERLKSWMIAIKKALVAKGLKADDATLEDYYIRGIDDATILDELATKVSTGEPKGEVAGALQALQNVANANGIDLKATFGAQVDTWLSDISKGTPIADFVNIIRNKAAEGKPKFVQDQLKLGKDLRAIYGTYINAMANAFNIDADSIDVNDPLLLQAFNDKGGIKLNDFNNLLRKDKRFGQTPAAASEADFRQQVVDRALAIGAKVTDADIDAIVQKLSGLGISLSTNSIDAELRKFITYGAGSAVTGQAGNNLQILRDTAMRNGLDLEKAFGGSVQDWLQKIDQGESIETYKRLIRDAAKMGLPDNVKKMLDQGVDLTTIFDPYRSYMSRILEIDPNTIDINDPTLRSAIGPDKEMTLYDFQRSLRKDPRWQYTDNARQDTSNAVLGVLRDFGFQG